MTMTLSEKFYGLSEGVFKACQFLGLKFPTTIPKEIQSVKEHMPSDYFGDDFELDEAIKKKICDERGWKTDTLAKAYNNFSRKFLEQKCFSKHCKTDLNVYFCEFALFVNRKNGVDYDNYFNFEFYRKSPNLQDEFVTKSYRDKVTLICNEPGSMELENEKSKTNEYFDSFLHRDWIYTRTCTFEEFKAFVEKHPRFFSKPNNANQGIGAQIISIDLNKDIEKIFADLKNRNRIIEEVVTQHESLQAFCPDTVNTIRVNTFLDIHNVVHILSTSGRFGKTGTVIDNLHGGGVAVIIDPKSGIIISDGINEIHERFQKHPDTGKTFKGFQYPSWKKLRTTVTKMAKLIPQMRHIGWDIAINDRGEPILIEINSRSPAADLQQSADCVGRRPLYTPLLDELQNYKREHMKLLGWRVNNLPKFDSSYELDPKVWKQRLKFAMTKLIPPPTCHSLLDLGCRKEKLAKSFCPENMIYCPVDFKKHDDEVIACDFNNGEFPDVTADAILCTWTAEFVEHLPQFLSDMCNAAQKQILMWCRPVDKEIYDNWRWNNPFLVDFTEEFLVKTMAQNNFELHAQYPDANPSVILYDFRKTSLK